jgi:hypothetical protein
MPELFAALDAFLQEHRRCGEPDDWIGGEREGQRLVGYLSGGGGSLWTCTALATNTFGS